MSIVTNKKKENQVWKKTPFSPHLLLILQQITDSENTSMETVLLIYGSSTLCVEICRTVNPDVDAPSPDPYGEQLFELEREAVKILKYVTGRYAKITDLFVTNVTVFQLLFKPLCTLKVSLHLQWEN